MNLNLSLTALCIALLTLSADANLLRNAGFQYGPDGTTNAHEAAQYWTTWGEASRQNWGAHDVDGWLASLHGWSGTNSAGWRQDVRAIPQTRYVLSGYFSADATYTYTNLYLKLEFLDEGLVELGSVTTLVNGVGTGWSPYAVEGTSPVAVAWVRAVVLVEGQGLADAFKFDALDLSTRLGPLPPPPPNLLANAGFQYGPDGTTNAHVAAQHWIIWGGASRENWGSRDGDGWLASLHGWGATNYGGWWQDVPATPGLRYQLNGYFSADTPYTYTNLFLKLEFMDAALAQISSVTTLVSGVGTDWTYYEVEGTAPLAAAWVRAVVLADWQGTDESFKFDMLHLSATAAPARARLEPAYGVLSGAGVSWEPGAVAAFNRRTGWDHVCFVDFTDFPHSGGYAYLDDHVAQVRDAGGIYVLTLEPNAGLDALTTEACEEMANWCADWNSQGVPVMIRFGHEMNGSWYAWRMRPALYREKFRLLAGLLHGAATNTATLWAPNEATGYPFNEYNGMTRAAYTNGYGTPADWTLLDSNEDGVLSDGPTLQDDPYAPFYPGDAYVDWVGMTLYHWGNTYPWHFNCVPETRKFSDSITGNYNGLNGDSSWAPDFYTAWAEGHAKPMMIPEKAAFYRPSEPPTTDIPPGQTNDELAVKLPWLEQVFNVYGDTANALDVAEHFPRLRAINWFNHYKIEVEAQNDFVNWTVTSNAAVAGQYRLRLGAARDNRRYFLHVADLKGLTYDWNFSSNGWTYGGAPFTAGFSTNQPYEGQGCLRVDYTNSAPPYGLIAAADYAALHDPLNTWSNGNAIHVQVRVPPGPDWATVRLSMESAETGWNTLAYTSCPPDGAWHQLVFPYDWTRHDASAWLNLYLQLDLPTNTSSTVYLDAFRVVVDSNTNGLTAAEESDDDSDGLPDAWEEDHLLNPRLRTDAEDDADGDGHSNRDEFRIGTNPRDDGSALRFTGNRLSASNAFSWSAASNVTYIIQAADALTGTWYDVSGALATNADGALQGVQLLPGADRLYYRLSACATGALPQYIPASDERLAFRGRFDQQSAFGPRAAWPAVEMNFRFQGAEANVLVQDTPVWPDANNPLAGNELQVVLDDAATSTVTLVRGQQRYRIASGLAAGAHEIRLVKRTEALVGDVQFVGVELPADGVLLAPTPAPARRLELIGDSVTSGYGNEAPDETHPFRPETENAALTFGALAGRALGADTRLLAWSGRGVYRNGDGSTVDTMSDLYLRTLPREAGSTWSFANWAPQVVVINLGVNDFAVDTPSREAFCAAYSNLINTVRANYVDPHIFCCVSSTPTDSWPAGQNRRTTLRAWLTDLVGGYVAQGQARTYFLEFAEQQPADGYGADYHPSLTTHLKMAGQLYTSVVQQVGW